MVPRAKISTQKVPSIKSVSRGKKSMYMFHEEENQHATRLKNKVSILQVPRTKYSAGYDFNE